MPKKRGNNEGSIVRRKDGRWMASITVGRDPETGKLKRVSFYGKTRQEAADQMAKALADHSRGNFIAPHRMTVGQWIEVWLKEYKAPSVRPKTLEGYGAVIRCYIKPAIGDIPLKNLRPEHVQMMYNDALKQGLSPQSIRFIHAVLHGSLEQAEKGQLVLRNVSEATALPRETKTEIHPLNLDQVKKLLHAIKEHRLYPAILLEVNTGLRRGELLAIRWDDVDLQKGLLKVKRNLVRTYLPESNGTKTGLLFQEPKTEKSKREVPIPKSVVDELARHKARQAEERLLLGQEYQDRGLIFCQERGKPYDPGFFTKSFRRMLKRAGLPQGRFHDLRHATATLLLQQTDIKTVSAILGHSRTSITADIYLHTDLGQKREAINKLNAALQGRGRSGK